MKRRQFLKTSGAMVACACTAGGATACKMITGVSDTPAAPPGSYETSGSAVVLSLKKIPPLGKVGGSVKIEIDDKKHDPLKIVVVRVDEDEYRALSNKCTHGGREMEYLHDKKTLTCVSFGHSRYDAAGKVIEGPAENPLALFPVALADGKLTILV